MDVPIDQVIAYGITIASLTLFLVERKRNSRLPAYMSLQGLLKATYSKYIMHWSNYGNLIGDRNEGTVSWEEHKLYVQMVALDYEASIENILGIMKSLEIKEDTIFDKNDFTGHEDYLEKIKERRSGVSN